MCWRFFLEYSDGGADKVFRFREDLEQTNRDLLDRGRLLVLLRPFESLGLSLPYSGLDGGSQWLLLPDFFGGSVRDSGLKTIG